MWELMIGYINTGLIIHLFLRTFKNIKNVFDIMSILFL